MIAALATMIFLSVALAATVSIAGSLEASLSKIGAALRCDISTPAVQPAAMRFNVPYPKSRVQRVTPQYEMSAAA